MSSYIIAGSADSIDTAYCEQIARRVKAKYSNIDFRVVIKHPSEWEDYLQQICRIYGFLKKSNPIVYTFDGKMIGSRQAFVQTTCKYFGLDEEALIVENLSNKVNMKLAEEQISRKHIAKHNIKTLGAKINATYESLLKSKIIKHQLQPTQTFLVNGIQYIYREVQGMCTPIRFAKNKQVPVVFQEVVPEEINLMALSLNDQIKPEETILKEAFVTTNNEKQKHPASEQDRLSEVSKTNKMHESILSYDKDSKGVKESNHTKLRIDEQNDDVPDYIDQPVKDTLVCELADQFYVTFERKPQIHGQMIFYHNEDPNGNTLRVYNDGRPIKGHRAIIKEIHFDNQVEIENIEKDQAESKEEIEEDEIQNGQIQSKQEIAPEEHNQSAQKSKTQPNIQEAPGKSIQEDAISEPDTELNILSHLNYHTLFIQKPLSQVQIKNILYFVRDTNTIACLQFLPQNPNPKAKLYSRHHLLGSIDKSATFPVQRFIEKQLEQKQFKVFSVPSEKSALIQFDQIKQTYSLQVINEIGFQHYMYPFSEPHDSEQQIARILKYTIDHVLAVEEEIKRDVGYNLILTRKYLIVVPIVEPYALYNGAKLYLQGLAYLGFLQLPHLQTGYRMDRTEPKTGKTIREMLASCSGHPREE